jgi:TorA maturation chaperone TorD
MIDMHASASRNISQDKVGMEADAEQVLRANTYSLLASLLVAPPSEDRLALLKQIDVPAGNGQSAMAAAWHALRLAGERATLEALDDEYHDLFIGVGRGELLPYGSWYMSGFLMDQPLMLLRQDLAALGFERQHDVPEPEDHVAALCETMSLIISSGEEIPADTQHKFFADHLGPWMGKFFGDLQEAKSARFYCAVGQLGEQFIKIEQQYLAMLA